MRRLWMASLAMALVAGAGAGDMVVQRWGAYRFTQHRGVEFRMEPAGRRMVVDLKALPEGTKVYRARLVFTGGNGYEVASDGKELTLVEPYCLWFDATDAVRGWVKAGADKGVLTIRRGTGFKPQNAYLEIAYEGDLADTPRQVTGLKAFHWHGQTFLRWKEIEDLAEGNAEITWGEMAKKVRSANPMVGIIPKWPEREIRYSVYRYTRPITAANIGQAEFVHDVMQGSVYAEDSIAMGRRGEHGPVYLKAGQVLRRVMLEKGEFLPPGTGYHWVTVTEPGKAYYAVVTSVNGVENTTDISEANAVGPLDEKVAQPRPKLVAERVTELRAPKDAVYHEQWYSWWCIEPLSGYPRRYDVAVGFCPQTMKKPPALTIVRESWNYPIRMPRPTARKDIVVGHTMDLPIAFRMGPNDCHYSLESLAQGKWRPWPMRRQEALVAWMHERYGIDRDRVTVSMGAWGMMEIERPDLYACIHGWGQPEVTKGFQCWNRAQGVWGPPQVYEGRPDQENPYWRSNFTRYVLADPARETPFFIMYPIRSAHLTEMGWPPFPRFWRAMMETKRPFVVQWQAKHRPVFRRDRSVPAFGNCTLDDMPGNGDLRNGQTFDTQLNGFLSWDGQTIVDEPDRWEMTVILDDGAPLPECRVDLTPRKCRKFRPKPGEEFRWTCTPIPAAGGQAGKPLGSGKLVADQWGLATIRQMRLLKGRHRVVISRP